MSTMDTLFSTKFHRYHLHHPHHQPPIRTARKFHHATPFPRRRTVLMAAKSGPSESQPEDATKDDFVSKVLKSNPSQVEPRYLIGEKLCTLKEKRDLEKNSNVGFGGFMAKRLGFRGRPRNVETDTRGEAMYLKDILREYRGKLYVPEQVFGTELSEEEEFDRGLEELPRMTAEEFRKAMKSDKVKLLTSKEVSGGVALITGYVDFIVDLKEIPGEKRLQRTKWAMRLGKIEAQEILKEYVGPQCQIGRQLKASVEKLLEHPHPVASSISSRIMVELGMVTAVMAAAAVLVGGFLASAVFAVTSLVFVTAAYVIRPTFRPLLKLLTGIIYVLWEKFSDFLYNMFGDGGFFSKLNIFYLIGDGVTGLDFGFRVTVVIMSMVLLIRFTLSRRPKNFRKWDLWQGVDFSRSKAEARVDGSTGVKFSDVAGIEEAVDELQELVRYLKNPELFDKMGIKPPHGVLLEGPPGCGKTLVAKAIAGEAGVPFFEMAGSEFVEVLVGVGAARIRDLFKRAKVNKPSVIFVDEIDALATRRRGVLSSKTDNLYNAATQERETTLNQLLIELDGFDTGKGVIFLAATNRRDLLDPALLRPGRFDRKIRIRPPNVKGRLDILKIHARKVKMSESVDLSSYAKNLPGWSGARLAQLVQEAALVAIRQGHSSILSSDMDDAIDRLTVGPKRIGMLLGHQGQCRRATTEVGVAITSHLLRRYENAQVECCDRISIIPRGLTLSQLVFHRLDDESYVFERRPQLLHRLQVFLGGRAAEEVIYGQDTSTASVAYLGHASWLARKIITIWNLEDPMVIFGEPTPLRMEPGFVGPRLDFEGALYRDYNLRAPPLNPDLVDHVSQRSEELVEFMYERTISLLRRHHAALLKTVKVLLNQKEITGEEIDYILNNYPPQTRLSLLLEEENPGSIPFSGNQCRNEVNHATQSLADGKSL